MGKEEVSQKEGTDTPIITSRKKSMWQRPKCTLEEESRDSDFRISITEKRDFDNTELAEIGITKKLKQGVDIRRKTAHSNAVAAQQPRRSP